MTLVGVLLGVINIAIWVAILLLVGALVVWFLKAIAGWEVPADVRKLYLVVVALIALYMLVALLLGIPTYRIVGSNDRPPIGATVEAPSTQVMR